MKLFLYFYILFSILFDDGDLSSELRTLHSFVRHRSVLCAWHGFGRKCNTYFLLLTIIPFIHMTALTKFLRPRLGAKVIFLVIFIP